MLRLEGSLDVLVQLLVSASGFRSVEVAVAYNMAIAGREVESIGDGLEIAQRDVLMHVRLRPNLK